MTLGDIYSQALLTVDIGQMSPLLTKFVGEIGNCLGDETVVCVLFLRPCFASMWRFWYLYQLIGNVN